MGRTCSTWTRNCTPQPLGKNHRRCNSLMISTIACKSYNFVFHIKDISSICCWRLRGRSAILCNNSQQLYSIINHVKWKRKQQLLHCACRRSHYGSQSIAGLTSKHFNCKSSALFIKSFLIGNFINSRALQLY